MMTGDHSDTIPIRVHIKKDGNALNAERPLKRIKMM